MKLEIAEKYPLLKDYDFTLSMGGRSGSGILLVPKNDRYIGKNYGFGLLSLVPYLQEAFSEFGSIEVRDLISEMKEEGERSLIPNSILDKDFATGERRHSFLETTLRKFNKHGITRIDKREGSESFLFDLDIISPGDNYSLVRVYDILGSSTSHEEAFSEFLL